MAMTLKLNVSFPMTIVVKSEAITAFSEAREKVREMSAEKVAELRGETKARVELFRSDKSNEELFELIYRAGIREFITKDMRSEIAGDDARIKLGSVKVEFAAQCHLCIHNTNCIKAARIGCTPVTK